MQKRTKTPINQSNNNNKSTKSSANGTAEQKSKSQKYAFLPDDVIANSWVYRALYWIFLIPVWKLFWNYTGEGWEKVTEYQKQGKKIFFIGRHTTHNHDILINLMCAYETHGHVSRSLIHRILYHSNPIFKYMGCVPGQRDTAIELINAGFWTGVIPGGAEEALKGHENSYNLFWGKRQGFAHVAKQTKCAIIPFATRNGEEMKFNPIFWLINKLRLYIIYDWIQGKNIPFVSWIVKQFVMYSWYALAFLGIPIPVKVTAVVGEPVDYDPEKDSPEEIVRKSKEALQGLLDMHHPGGKSYIRGLKERFTGKAELAPEKYYKKKKAN